jgi:hypothetical protein
MVIDGTLSTNERRIMDALLLHKGVSQAIKMRDLEALTGLRSRRIRITIQRLKTERGMPIGSISRPPYGYFMCVTDTDAESAYRELICRAVELLRDARALKNSRKLKEVLGQVSLLLSSGRTSARCKSAEKQSQAQRSSRTSIAASVNVIWDKIGDDYLRYFNETIERVTESIAQRMK